MINSLRSEKVILSVLVLFLVTVQGLVSEEKLSVCSKAKEGNQTLYRKVSGNDGVVICIKHNGNYAWKSLDGSSTLGENFNPAKDCSHIVENFPEARDGFYWIKHTTGKPIKGWCDTHTDAGGFLLIGMKNTPVTWNVPSNDTPVDPSGPPHWSSEFGDVKIQDLAIQISTTKNFEDTKAHWLYRLKTHRALGNLFGIGSGGCTDFHSGIGNISYVKDILTETVVTENFTCSKFGPDTRANLGWCCACFGPKGGRGHYCRRKCQPVNGGTVLTGHVHVWYWIRTRMPKRVWKRCMEFKMKTAAGKFETYHIDRNTGTAHKGTCSNQFQTLLNEGKSLRNRATIQTLLVKNKESFKNLPPVQGMFAYREDNEKLYLKKGDKWAEIGSEKKTENLSSEVKQLKVHLQNKDSQQDTRIQNLETNIPAKFRNLITKNSQQDTQFKNLKTNITATLKSLGGKLNKIETKLNATSLYGSIFNPGKSCKDILASDKFAASGTYWIKPTVTKLFQVYCDMETHGGGWTLVYSYTFTNYNSFNSSSNAVTPRPNWPARGADVPISTSPPLSESSLGAVDWNIWKNIGQEFMIKSNINDWIACQPNSGSLVTKTRRLKSVSCQNIKNVATACSGVAPYIIYWGAVGPVLRTSQVYYFFEGSTNSYWPVHDPCGKYNQNHKKGVSNPGGQIYLR